LAWFRAGRNLRADEQAMRRLEFVCGLGWSAVTFIALASPLLGVMALGFSVALVATTLVLAYLVTAPHSDVREDDTWMESSSLRPSERACLVRIINLSRVAARPSGTRLLLRELEEAFAEEPLAYWRPLRELHAVVRSESGRLAPFESEP
jgi:hypothetical protein